MRTFHSPNGRLWSASVYQLPAGVGVATRGGVAPVKSVLRFECENVTLDLPWYPPQWEQLPDQDLALLLRRASTPEFSPIMSR